MRKPPIWRARIDKEARLKMESWNEFHAYLERHRERDVEVIVRRRSAIRTTEQNAYWHAVPVALMAEYMGEEHMATHYALLGECFGYHWSKKFRREVPNKGSSSALTTEEFSHLIEWCPPWALAHHGVHIPLPNEVYFQSFEVEP